MRSLVAALLIAGCGGGIDAKDFGNELRAALCDQQVRCGGTFPDVASCDNFYGIQQVATLLDEINKGLVTYDADKAEQCVNFYRNEPCDSTSMESRTGNAACSEIVGGTLKLNDVCQASEECESQQCSTPSCGMACCAGTCVAATTYSKLGEPCATRSCDKGLACDNTKTCVMLFTEGMACENNTQCNYGLACDGAPGFCRHAAQIGDSCPDGVCANLVSAYCSADKICTLRGFPGAACTTNAECSFYYPCNTMTGQCEAYPTLGQACFGLCSDGTYCDATMSVCVAKLADGGACSTPQACQSNYCDTTCKEEPICD